MKIQWRPKPGFAPGTFYVWQELQDSELAQAIAIANEALELGKEKNRIFTSTPVPTYDVGDLWVQGATGDIMRCKTARESGAFTSSDWEKASKYTDDSALKNFINGDFANAIDTMTEQIDGKIETWFQTSDPASNWTTNAEKAKNEIDDKIKELIKTTPIPSLISICAKCNATSDNTKLYHASCNYNHNYCFNCIFQSFFANISDALNNSNNKNQIIIQCPLCCNTTLCGNIIIPSKEFNSNLKELFNKLPTNYTKLLPVCAHHNNKFTKYCDDCNCYICDFCANSEHKKHSFKSIKEKEEDIKEKIKKIPYKINNYDTKAKEINEKNEKNYNDIYTKTVNEIDKLIHVLNELKKIFINQMKINLTYYETYTDIINTSYSNYYTQEKIVLRKDKKNKCLL